MEFNEFCKENGIRRQLTTAYTPQQNGVAERKNRTVMNLVRSMLAEKKIPKTFWPEALHWSIYVLNRSPTAAIPDMTPEEVWTGMRPSVEHFRVFGCIAHAHIPDARRTKLENKSRCCVLLGVSEESKGYRLYDPISKTIVVSRDVIFKEEKHWNWDISYTEHIEMNLDWKEDDETSGDQTNTNGDEGNTTETSAEMQTEQSHEETNELNTGITREELVMNGRNEGVTDSPNVDDDNEPRDTVNLHRRRQTSFPSWMRDYVSGDELSEEETGLNMAMVPSDDPVTYEEAVVSKNWRNAMDTEMQSIQKNKTWSLIDLPEGAKKIGVKWIYKTKLNESGKVDKFKARLVAKGYAQQHGVDYTEVFAPVARLDTVRIICALAVQRNWVIYQLDVKSAFLHGELSEDVFVDQPKGYEEKGNEHKVYKLHKALYGLKQAPRAWFSRIEDYFTRQGFQKCISEHTLFIKQAGGRKILIVSVYVDDLIFTGDDEQMMLEFKESMMKEFDMTDLGKMRFFLGIEALQQRDGIYICQRKYATEVLKRFGMEDCKAVMSPMVPGYKAGQNEDSNRVDETYYKQMVGSLMYITTTRPDVMFAASFISRFMAKPKEIHLQAAKRVLRYLKGTVDYGIFYKKSGNQKLIAFTDSDYAGDIDDRRSTSGYVFLLSGGAISWSSKKQPIVTLSSTEAEFVAAAACACQAVWMRRILENLNHEQEGCTTLLCDNSSTIKLSRNPIMHGRSKHIDVRFHFLRDLTRDKVIELVHCNSQDQVADLLTKPIKQQTFEKLREQLGLCMVHRVN